MGRKPCCVKVGLKKGPWTVDEDKKLIHFMFIHGQQFSWRDLPTLAGLLRCGKSCRLRWTNYLRPDLKRGLLSETEEKIVIDLHAQLGNKWSKIASHLPGRTDNEIKNYWNSYIKKKLMKMGIDPLAHQPLPPPKADQPPPKVAVETEDEVEPAADATITESAKDNEDKMESSTEFLLVNNADEIPVIKPPEIPLPSVENPSSSASSSSTTSYSNSCPGGGASCSNAAGDPPGEDFYREILDTNIWDYDISNIWAIL